MDNLEKIVFAGGCFWCTEAVFERVEGVEQVTSGYTGGFIKNPAYREICTGRTGHAEGAEVVFNPEVISLEILLSIFFATHDPTTHNQQGNDKGTQYRSAIFYTTEVQKDTSKAFIQTLEADRVFDNPIVTEIKPLDVFYTAEDYHQDYYAYHQEQPYCQIIINPKLEKLKRTFSNHLKQKSLAS